MTKQNKPKSRARQKPPVHSDLKDLDIHVNEFGEIVREYNVEQLNTFLNEKVKDKKLNNETSND